jgi:hypothetical protein
VLSAHIIKKICRAQWPIMHAPNPLSHQMIRLRMHIGWLDYVHHLCDGLTLHEAQ